MSIDRDIDDPSLASPAVVRPLPLESGDRLTRGEFERRYMAMPDLKKAELLEGVVYVPSPVRFTQHGGPHADLMAWLGHYRAHTPGVLAGDNSTVRMDQDNEPQPDAVLWLDPACGGKCRVDADGYLEGSPELAAEVTASRASYDLDVKLKVYRRSGVREYVVWRVLDHELDWFVLREGRYDPLSPSDGILRSEIFPGLWLDASALLRGDLATVLAVLQSGIASREHADFVARLSAGP